MRFVTVRRTIVFELENKVVVISVLLLTSRVIYLSPASPTGMHVVRTGYGSYGRGRILHLSSTETTVSINTKF